MAELTQQKPIIRITFDEMEAYMLLPEPEQGTGYTDSQIRQEMAARGITTGIDEQRISDMLEGHTYNASFWSRRGRSRVWERTVTTNTSSTRTLDGKPKLLPDGSVDYWSVHSIESVTAGQVIAVYHPAVSGEDGMSVKGRLVPAKHGREQMPLKGKGFDRMDDEVTYTASMDGKIEMQNDRLWFFRYMKSRGMQSWQRVISTSAEILSFTGMWRAASTSGQPDQSRSTVSPKRACWKPARTSS